LTYYSGEGKGLRGCFPHVNFRKALLNCVLIKEEELVDEDDRSKPLKFGQLAGERCYEKFKCKSAFDCIVLLFTSFSFMGILYKSRHHFKSNKKELENQK
jgi:hypothetical protein